MDFKRSKARNSRKKSTNYFTRKTNFIFASKNQIPCAGFRPKFETPDIPTGQFHRVLSNILNNAIEAVQINGKVQISVRYCSKNKKIDLVVSDDGPGVPIDQATHIFEKHKTFGKINGSGLGLYHAKLCIEAFGGQLKLLKTSKSRGHGASFLIRLPVIT